MSFTNKGISIEENRIRRDSDSKESTSPSLRHISHTRVNHFERQRLLNSTVDYNSTYVGENEPLIIGMPHKNSETDSIQYKSPVRAKPNSITSHLLEHLESSPLTDEISQSVSEYHPETNHGIRQVELETVLPYYLPIFSWIRHYNFAFFLGDLLGGLSLVFFQLPLSLSYATSLAKVPIICGLLSLGISPLIYMVFGSVPQMIVGPEAAISLIVGQAVEPLLHHKKLINPIELVVAITFVSGATLLGFGLGRFGFLDNVLSGSLLKGFISGVGIVMIINSAVLMLGLNELMKQINDNPDFMDIHSPFDKLVFLVENITKYDSLTTRISLLAFFFLFVVSLVKNYGIKRKFNNLDKLIYIPEILIMLIIATYLCYKFKWNEKGIDIVGKIKENGGITVHNPFTVVELKYMKKLSTAGFLCAMLGFFESTTASKSLGSRYNLPISSNRELVALGFINIVGSLFGALPAFGGYGRSKINAISAKTTMLGGLMGLFTFLTVFFLLDYLYYIPKCILSAITAHIGLLLIEEAPYELLFHWRTGGYNELITFFVTVITTIFFSMEAGIAVGLIYLLIRVIKHSAMSRIQILGRIPDTNTFVDADINEYLTKSHARVNANIGLQLNVFTDDYFTSVNTEIVEEIEGCLIVKIPEPLTFTNSSDLKGRLKRVEMYGSTKAHPALKRSRDVEMTQYVIFDLRGMSEIDSSACQILKELIINYQNRNILLFFVRVSKHIKVRQRLEKSGITQLLRDDLIRTDYYHVQDGYKLQFQQYRAVDNNNQGVESILNLTENYSTPYFVHISDALKVIDYYENIIKDYIEC